MSNQKGFLKIAIIIIALILIGGGYFVFNEKDRDISIQDAENQNSRSNQSSASSGNDNVSTEINPKDYSLEEHSFKQSPIYSQLPEYCSDLEKEPWTIQQDTRLVKNSNEVIIPSIRQLIFASGNEEPNCVTIVKVFSVPQSGKYLYLEVSKLTFKEHSSWPVYRIDLSDLSIKKLSISAGGSIRVEEGENFMGFISSNNTLLSDGKKIVWWDERAVYLINLETDSESILYTAPQNQWLISGVDPNDVIGQFFNTDVQMDKNQNQITIGVYDKIMSQDGKRIFDESGDINWLELEPKGERLIEHKFKLMYRVTISIPNDQSVQSLNDNPKIGGICENNDIVFAIQNKDCKNPIGKGIVFTIDDWKKYLDANKDELIDEWWLNENREWKCSNENREWSYPEAKNKEECMAMYSPSDFLTKIEQPLLLDNSIYFIASGMVASEYSDVSVSVRYYIKNKDFYIIEGLVEDIKLINHTSSVSGADYLIGFYGGGTNSLGAFSVSNIVIYDGETGEEILSGNPEDIVVEIRDELNDNSLSEKIKDHIFYVEEMNGSYFLR